MEDPAASNGEACFLPEPGLLPEASTVHFEPLLPPLAAVDILSELKSAPAQ